MNFISFYHIHVLSAGRNAVRLGHFMSMYYIQNVLFLSKTRVVNEPVLFTKLAYPDNSLWIEKEQSDQEGANRSIFVT